MRIIIEGAPGSGKSTLVNGECQFDDPREYDNLAARGFQVLPESAATADAQLGTRGLPWTILDLKAAFLELEIQRHTETEEGLWVFDKALPGYMTFFQYGPFGWRDDYYEAVARLRYDSPVLLLDPIPSVNMETEQCRQRNKYLSLEDRWRIGADLRRIYDRLGYNIMRIPNLYDDPVKNNDARLERVVDFLHQFT